MLEGKQEKISSIKIDYQISDDKKKAFLRVSDENGEMKLEALDEVSVSSLIAALGNLRADMLEPIPDQMKDGTHPLDAVDPRWYILPDSTNSYATFWIRNPKYGWMGFGFPRHEAGKISKWFRKIIPFKRTEETLSPQASSFGGDKFLLTTEGLGFYYYGSEESRIGPNPFEQVEFDSDRAAGIVAGAIVDTRLEHALRSKLKNNIDVANGLFNSRGALGSFGAKIDLAYLMGILSEDSYSDLKILQKIRNDFAHNLGLSSFDEQSILDRCKNFKLVDKHIGPIPDPNRAIDGLKEVNKATPYMGLPDYEQKLLDPRFRYVMTSQIISSLLGQGADSTTSSLPYI